MNENNKNSSSSSHHVYPTTPILLRRRLSAPETIMRKHMISQPFCNFHDSEEKSGIFRNTDRNSGSFPNLYRRKDYDVMRKSTLLRRMWSNSKQYSKTNSLYNSHNSFTNSQNSNNSSAENLSKSSRSKLHRTSTTFSPKSTTTEHLTSEESVSSCNKTIPTLDGNLNIASKKLDGESSNISHLNVISNVKLSESTLDLIFTHVVNDIDRNGNLDNNDIISNIGANPYSKPPEIPQVVVPRYSATPRTSSMEVNVSSGDSEDVESDTISFVDSLDDPQSPKINLHATPRTADETSPSPLLLPDNSEKLNKKEKRSASSFFIPIENNLDNNAKALTDLLPGKVRNKLQKRQQTRIKKIQETENTPIVTETGLPTHPKQIKQKKFKPLLPRIDVLKSNRFNKNENTKFDHHLVNPIMGKYDRRGQMQPVKTVKNRIPNKLTPINRQDKEIEILNVIECCEEEPKKFNYHQKSRIPVRIQRRNAHKPTYLDSDYFETMDNTKLDQLIANILIDTLNNDLSDSNSNKKAKNIERKFDLVPKELSIQNLNNVHKFKLVNDGKEGIEGKNTVPKGWITFYLMNKQGELSPDSSSDEGLISPVEQVKSSQTQLNKHTYEEYSTNKRKTNLEDKNFYLLSKEDNLGLVNSKSVQTDAVSTKKSTSRQLQGEWSVTLRTSDRKELQFPDINVKIQFSPPERGKKIYSNSQSDSGIGDDNTVAQKKLLQHSNNRDATRILRISLPQIHQHNRPQLLERKLSNGVLGPKDNKSSTLRYHLSRSNIYKFYEYNNNNNL